MGKVRDLLYPGHDPYANLDLLPFDGFTWEKNPESFGECIMFSRPKLIIEVGSFLGGSTRHMARILNEQGMYEGAEIVCIDTWLGSWEHRNEEFKNQEAAHNLYSFKYKNGRPMIYEQFLSNNIHTGIQDIVTPFPIDSFNGLVLMSQIDIQPDMIYVDGAHDYELVVADLGLAATILRPGGVILGDDYFSPEIQKACDFVFGKGKVIPRDPRAPTKDTDYRKFIWIK